MNKKIFILTAILILNSVPAFANCGMCPVDGKAGKAGGDWAEQKAVSMAETLDLNEEQASQLKTILTEKKEKKNAAMENMHAQMQTIQDEYAALLKAILTPEQQQKLDALHEDKESMKGHGHGSQHPPMGIPGHRADLKEAPAEAVGK